MDENMVEIKYALKNMEKAFRHLHDAVKPTGSDDHIDRWMTLASNSIERIDISDD